MYFPRRPGNYTRLARDFFYIFSKTVFTGRVLHGSLLYSVLEHGNFLTIDISQGSVATCLRYREILNNDFIENVLLSLSMKEF